MDPSIEKHIEIRANGQLFAKGELVQLEDRLGVEITELQMEHSDGK
jgi:type III secretion protein Q